MLSSSETQSLKKLLLRQKGRLQQLEEEYFTIFKETISLFNACAFLSELLLTQELPTTARVISLYLLLSTYSECDPQNHPFLPQILKVSERTENKFIRNLIFDILIKANHGKYFAIDIEEFESLYEKDKENCEEDKEIKKLRKNFEDKYGSYDLDIPNDDEELDFLRLMPEYISISPSELNWLSPGIISDVEWDNSAEIDKKLEKSRKIYEIALKRALDSQERTELMSSIETDPYCSLHIGFSVKDLQDLMSHNSLIAASLIIKISKYPCFQEYLEQFLALPTSASLLDTMARIVKELKIPQSYITFFCSHHMQKMIKTKETSDQHKALVYTMVVFLRCMIENVIVDKNDLQTELNEFKTSFGGVVDFGVFGITDSNSSHLEDGTKTQ